LHPNQSQQGQLTDNQYQYDSPSSASSSSSIPVQQQGQQNYYQHQFTTTQELGPAQGSPQQKQQQQYQYHSPTSSTGSGGGGQQGSGQGSGQGGAEGGGGDVTRARPMDHSYAIQEELLRRQRRKSSPNTARSSVEMTEGGAGAGDSGMMDGGDTDYNASFGLSTHTPSSSSSSSYAATSSATVMLPRAGEQSQSKGAKDLHQSSLGQGQRLGHSNVSPGGRGGGVGMNIEGGATPSPHLLATTSGDAFTPDGVGLATRVGALSVSSGSPSQPPLPQTLPRGYNTRAKSSAIAASANSALHSSGGRGGAAAMSSASLSPGATTMSALPHTPPAQQHHHHSSTATATAVGKSPDFAAQALYLADRSSGGISGTGSARSLSQSLSQSSSYPMDSGDSDGAFLRSTSSSSYAGGGGGGGGGDDGIHIHHLGGSHPDLL
jgi:hypothetical protein